MSEYKIPLIPDLNLEKNDRNHYEFNVNVGKIKSKKTGQISKIYNIKIEIYDKIDIYFEIDGLDYSSLFMEEVSSENGKKFIDNSEVKFFDISCDFNDYNISLLNFYLTTYNHEVKNGYVKDSFLGKCDECLLVKNNNFINDDENVRVWNILECSNTSHPGFREFKSSNLSNVFLKSRNTDDYGDYERTLNLKLKNNLQKKQHASFDQLLGEDSFLYYEKLYGEVSNEIIDNIEKLLMFYDSNIVPSRFVVFESIDTKKIIIKIKPKNNYKLNGSSIFKKWPYNLFNFINSSYDSYINTKNSDIDIDLLLHYYVWIKNEQYAEVSLMLCSEFLEVLKNSRNQPHKNENSHFYDKIFQRFNFSKLDTYKLLKILQPEIFQLITNLEKEYIDKGYNNKDVIKICKKYKKEYLLRCIERYRNKIIHSGKFEVSQKDIDKILDKLIIDFKNDYIIDNQIVLIEEIGNDIKVKLKNINGIFDIFKQANLFERVIEIFLLKLLNVDCLLIKNHSLKSQRVDEYDFNSKYYVEKFIKK